MLVRVLPHYEFVAVFLVVARSSRLNPRLHGAFEGVYEQPLAHSLRLALLILVILKLTQDIVEVGVLRRVLLGSLRAGLWTIEEAQKVGVLVEAGLLRPACRRVAALLGLKGVVVPPFLTLSATIRRCYYRFSSFTLLIRDSHYIRKINRVRNNAPPIKLKI